MADYYYTKDGERRGPVPEAELRSLVGSGAVESADYFWTQGMTDWKLISDGDFSASATPVITPSPEPAIEPTPEPTTGEEATPAVTRSPFDDSPAITPTDPAPAPAVAQPAPATAPYGTSQVVAAGQSDTVFVRDVANALPRPLWLILPGVISIVIGIPYLLFFLLGAIYIWIGVLLFQANSGLESARRTGSRNDLMTALSKINTLFIIVGVLTIISIVLAIGALLFLISVGGNPNF